VRWSDPSQESSQQLDRVPFASDEARESDEGELRLGEHQDRRFRLEPAVPADGSAFELLRLLLGEEVEVAERVLEGDAAEVAE
jgi:hypothetical protein